MQKAYAPKNTSASILLEQAKEQMDGTELKLLMLMLQMRGQFDRKGGTMVSKAMQTEGLVYTQHPLTSDSRGRLIGGPDHGPERRNLSVPAGPGPNERIYSDTDFGNQNHGFVDLVQVSNAAGGGQQPSAAVSSQDESAEQRVVGQVSHVQIQPKPLVKAGRSPLRKAPGIEIGVQAGDDLIKVTMDRVKLLEKQRHMFFAPTAAGDKYS